MKIDECLLDALEPGCHSVYWLEERSPKLAIGQARAALKRLAREGKVVRTERAFVHGKRTPALDVYALARPSAP